MRSAEARKPEIDVMLTMAPPFGISGTDALVSRKGPARFTSMVRWNSASVVSSAGLNTAWPALFTSASSCPKRAFTCAAAAST